jgi:hypothetical protein
VTQALGDLAERGLLKDPQTAAARVRLAADLTDALDGVTWSRRACRSASR